MPRDPIRRGDVYWVTYAFPHEKASTGSNEEEVEKQRPILILQNGEDNENAQYPLVQAAPITTQKTERVYAQDVLLPAGEANLQRTS
jgi:mRNA-degrading endonuclease toxin of MazEF toxin-antitoxin module